MVAVLLLAACGVAPAPTAPAVALPPELVFVRGTAGPVAVEVRDGSQAAQLGSGLLAARLSGGGDVAEAYVAGADLRSVKVGRPFVVLPLAPLPSPPVTAGIVPAPGLTTFVGDRTVLIVQGQDGVARAFQHGSSLWQQALGPLAFAGDVAVTGSGLSGWSLLAPESGRLSVLSGPCTPGPVGTAGAPYLDCSGGDEPWSLVPPKGATILVWPDGSAARLSGGKAVSARKLDYPVKGRPALSSGGTIYAPGGHGVLVQRLGADSVTIPRRGATAVALSRDGAFLYVLGGGRLDVFETSDRRARASYPVEGDSILLVAGG